MVVFLKELPECGQISLFQWALAQGPILHPHNHEAQDRAFLLGLAPIISGHTGDLQSIYLWGQGCIQVTDI